MLFFSRRQEYVFFAFAKKQKKRRNDARKRGDENIYILALYKTFYTKTMISLFTSALNVTGNLVSPMPNWLHVLKATMCFKSVVRIPLDADEEDVFKDETKSGATTPPRRLLSGA